MTGSYTYQFTNNASLNNIPASVRNIVDETIAAYLKIVTEDNIVCIFAEGSLTRGNFKPNISDFDTCAIVKKDLTDVESNNRVNVKSELDAKWRPKGIDKIDIGFVTRSKLLANDMPKMNFIFETDGVVVYGKKPAIERTWPDPGNTLSKMLNGMFIDSTEKFEKHLNSTPVFNSDFNLSRWIAKQGIRLLFGITMEASGEYSSKIEEYREYIDKYLNSELTNFDYLYSVYLSGKANQDQLLEA